MEYYRKVYKREALLAICCSERLLSKHQEVLESIVTMMVEPASSYRLVSNGLSVVTAGCAGMILPSLLGYNRPSFAVAATAALVAVPVLATVGYNSVMYRREFSPLLGFINGLDAFDVAATRVFVYFEEMSSYEHELLRAAAVRALTDCARGMQDVVENLYDLGRSLESDTDLAKAYDPVYELLEGREYFYKQLNAESGPEQLLLEAKKQRKVLLYLQSMCLYRWGLAIASGSDLGKARYTLPKVMTVLQESSKDMTAMLLPMPQDNTFRATAASKKVASLKARMLAIATNVTVTQGLLAMLIDSLDLVVNNPMPGDSKDLQLTASLLSAVRESTELRLQAIADLESDVARLISPEASRPKSTPQPSQTIQVEAELEDEMIEEAGLSHTMPVEDEFFLHTASTLDSAATAGVNADHDNEETPVEQVDKSTKRNYRTVLRQLHGKLQPIKQEFRVREQRALQRKGITTTLDHHSVDEEEDNEDEEDEDEEGVDSMSISSLHSVDKDLRCKRTNYQQRYHDAMEQLAAKPQINLFPRIAAASPQLISSGEEHILE